MRKGTPAAFSWAAASAESSADRLVNAYWYCPPAPPSEMTAAMTATPARIATAAMVPALPSFFGSDLSCARSWSIGLDAHPHDFLVRIDDLVARLGRHVHRDLGLCES